MGSRGLTRSITPTISESPCWLSCRPSYRLSTLPVLLSTLYPPPPKPPPPPPPPIPMPVPPAAATAAALSLRFLRSSPPPLQPPATPHLQSPPLPPPATLAVATVAVAASTACRLYRLPPTAVAACRQRVCPSHVHVHVHVLNTCSPHAARLLPVCRSVTPPRASPLHAA